MQKSTCSVLQFGTICPIVKHKNTCGDMLILVKVAGWSSASLKLTLPQLAHNVVTTLGFGCFLVAMSDNIVTML